MENKTAVGCGIKIPFVRGNWTGKYENKMGRELVSPPET